MARSDTTTIAQLVAGHENEILGEWLRQLKETGALQTGRISEAELQTQSKNFLGLFQTALEKSDSAQHAAYGPVRDLLADVSRSRAMQGFSPAETATFIFSLKRALFDALSRERQLSPVEVAKITWTVTVLVDDLGLYTMDIYQKTREELIERQQSEISELSTPVVKLWDGILALPLIGTLDSARKPVADDRERRRRDRDHRHHRRAHRRYADGAASAEDSGGGAADGCGLHHQRHPPSDRADHRPSRHRAERDLESDAGRCIRGRAAPDRKDGGHGQVRARRVGVGRASIWTEFRY